MSGSSPLTRATVLFSGSVQGVGFRYTARSVARDFNVEGYVRNLPDGRVELVAEGTPAEVDAFLAALDRAMSGYIRSRDRQDSPATGEFTGFSIRF